ncbi:MAG: hypothetical protein JWL64_1736 [Frankiales bacterium]|nr:hypothetical protein [Frankiales bacterium]
MARTDYDTGLNRERARTRVPRSRGALTGVLLMLLGAWGALIPFIGPSFDFAFTPDNSWDWTTGRFWMSVLPGVATIIAGILLLTTANRVVALFAGYLASAAGVWFIIGPVLLPHLPDSWDIGSPTGGAARQTWEQLGFFTGLGALILFLAAQAAGRVTVRSVRDGVLVDDSRTDARSGNVNDVESTRVDDTRDGDTARQRNGAHVVPVTGKNHTRTEQASRVEHEDVDLSKHGEHEKHGLSEHRTPDVDDRGTRGLSERPPTEARPGEARPGEDRLGEDRTTRTEQIDLTDGSDSRTSRVDGR